MRGWMAMAVLPLVAVVFAGCSSEPEAEPPVHPTTSVITDPRDVRNGTAPGSHIHDYWGGRDRVTVLAEEESVWSECQGGCAAGMSGARARPDEGLIVPQGTRWVNGTFTFTPHAEHDATTLELLVKTAADAEPKVLGDLVPGEPFSIESSRDQNDPPHYVLSLWEFQVRAKGTAQGVVFRGDYRWDVEAVRGLPLEPFPPHPDHWGGTTQMLLLETTIAAAAMYQMDGGTTAYFCTQCLGTIGMPDGKVVPYDTTRLEARLTGNFVGLAVAFHGADTWDATPVTGTLQPPDLVFDIPLLPNQADSPYATQSLWEFSITFDQANPEPRVWSGAVTLKVTAYKE